MKEKFVPAAWAAALSVAFIQTASAWSAEGGGTAREQTTLLDDLLVHS